MSYVAFVGCVRPVCSGHMCRVCVDAEQHCAMYTTLVVLNVPSKGRPSTTGCIMPGVEGEKGKRHSKREPSGG